MQSNGYVYIDQDSSFAEQQRPREQLSQWSFSYFPRQSSSGDSLICGQLGESVVKEEESLPGFPERIQIQSVDDRKSSACKREYKSEQSESDRSKLVAESLPPTKRPYYTSPSNSLQVSFSSSSNAQSPPDLLVDGNAFANRGFQMGPDDDNWRSVDEPEEFFELDAAPLGVMAESHLGRRVETISPALKGGLQRAFSERAHRQRYQQEPLQTIQASISEQQQQQLSLQFRQWSQIPCAPLLEVLSAGQQQQQQQQQLITRPAEISFSVQADKGFQFSGREGVWISQKKNHFQITCLAGVSGDQWAVPIALSNDKGGSQHQQQSLPTPPAYSIQLVNSFQLSLTAVRAESPFDSPTVGLEQAEANRTRRPFVPQPLRLPGHGVRLRAVAGRLHFSSATLNNQRRRGELHPDQRFFRLVVGLDAVLESGLCVPLCRQISGRVIVRASNPGQFEASAAGAVAADANESMTGEATTEGWRSDSAGVTTFSGRVGINTRTPGEALTVHGNLQLHGNLLQPSDARIKIIEDEIRPADQLANISRLRIYNYRRVGVSHGVEASETRDTGVIAQEVAGVLPDAVRKSSTQLVPSTGEPLLLVNKDRIYMENVGAVKQLGELTSSMEKRIGELERMRSKLCRLRDSMRAPGDSAASAATVESGTGVPSAEAAATTAPVEPAATPSSNKRKSSSKACGLKIATLLMALFTFVSCLLSAVAVLILAERLSLASSAESWSTGPLATSTSSASTLLTNAQSRISSLATKSGAATGQGSTMDHASSASLSSLPTYSTTRKQLSVTTPDPTDTAIRPNMCNAGHCPPVPCCQSSLMKLNKSSNLFSKVRKHSEAADVIVSQIRSARLASPNLGEWNLRVGHNAGCDATGHDGRLTLQFGGASQASIDSCRGSNMTLNLTLDATFPSDAELHLRLETNLTCSYCKPVTVYGRCLLVEHAGDSRSDAADGVGCVPVAGWGCDCNLGKAAAHLRHLATLRLTPTGLHNSCQSDREDLGHVFLELRLLIERQTYGCRA